MSIDSLKYVVSDTFNITGICINGYYTNTWIINHKVEYTKDIQKFPASYGTESFITVYKRAHDWALS